MDNYIWLIPVLPLAGFIINGVGRITGMPVGVDFVWDKRFVIPGS
jgi:hypothetical protein